LQQPLLQFEISINAIGDLSASGIDLCVDNQKCNYTLCGLSNTDRIMNDSVMNSLPIVIPNTNVVVGRVYCDRENIAAVVGTVSFPVSCVLRMVFAD
jgi:hypothetical protein